MKGLERIIESAANLILLGLANEDNAIEMAIIQDNERINLAIKSIRRDHSCSMASDSLENDYLIAKTEIQNKIYQLNN